jgi:hypothetical protein
MVIFRIADSSEKFPKVCWILFAVKLRTKVIPVLISLAFNEGFNLVIKFIYYWFKGGVFITIKQATEFPPLINLRESLGG